MWTGRVRRVQFSGLGNFRSSKHTQFPSTPDAQPKYPAAGGGILVSGRFLSYRLSFRFTADSHWYTIHAPFDNEIPCPGWLCIS